MSGYMLDVRMDTGAMILTAPAGSVCQSLAHDIDGPDVPAAVFASVLLAPHVIADVYLCDVCLARLAESTRPADYAAG